MCGMYYTKNAFYLGILLIMTVIASPYLSRAIFQHTDTSAYESEKITAFEETNSSPESKIKPDMSLFPVLTAKSILVSDIRNGHAYYQKNIDERFPIASLTKIMTSLLFSEMIPQNDLYRVTDKAKKTGPRISAIPEGAYISGNAIITLMMTESDNDVARLAAEKIGRTINFSKHLPLDFENALSSAVSAMNERSYALGMKNTNFMNPVGFDDALQYSTAQDIFTLMRYVFNHYPRIWRESKNAEPVISFKKTLTGIDETLTAKNTNQLIPRYPRIVGSKTGFTDEAGQAIILLYSLSSADTVAIIILKSDDRFGEAEKIIHWLDATSI